MICTNAPDFRTRRLVQLGCVLAMASLASRCVLAHTSLERYVRESVQISAEAENVDIRLQFSFPADLSLAERRIMDRDGDGALSKQEKDAYLNDVQARAERSLRLSVSGTPALLIPLADPVLDLQDAAGVEAHPHELRLAYFARVPKTFGVGGTLALDSGLWTDAPLMISVATEGAEGIRFQTVDAQGLSKPSTGGAVSRVTEARCTLWEPRGSKNGRK